MPKKKQLVPSAQPETRVPAMQPLETEEAGKQWEELFRFLNFRVMALKQEQTQVRAIQPETKKRLFDSFLELFTFLGFPALPSARDKLLDMLKTEGQANEELASGAFLTGMLAALVLVMERHLDASEEPTPEELEKTLAAFKTLRYQMRGMFKKSTATLVKAMPHDPGGHPRRFTKDESAQVCHEIAEMNEQGFLKSAAFKHLARKYKTSPRTIQREWQNRPKHK